MSNLGVLSGSSPFPFIVDGKFHDGIIYSQLNYCRKCEAKDCAGLIGKPFGHYLCSKKLSCYPIRVGSIDMVIFGLVIIGLNRELSGDRRKELKRNSVVDEVVVSYKKKLEVMVAEFNEEKALHLRNNFSVLHDIRTMIGIVLTWSQEIIAKTQGDTFEEKLRNAPLEQVNLLQSIDLLLQQLALADVVANPSSITYGKKNSISPHPLLFKMVRVMALRGSERKNTISLNGHSEIKLTVFNSFSLIPLILLDNALKYSHYGREIYVDLEGSPGWLTIRVASYGNIVPIEARQSIFDRYVRGPNVEGENTRGSGLGLYIAQQVANAHGIKIEYSASPSDGRVGRNEFYIRIPIGEPRA